MRIRMLVAIVAAAAGATAFTVAADVVAPTSAHAEQCIWIKAPDGTWIQYCSG